MLLIGNGKVITRDSANPYLENGAVVTDGENIKEVGTLDAMKQKYPEAEFVDAHGGVIMPGLINAHTHIYSGLARGLSIVGNNPTNFLEVLEGTWWAIDRQLDLDGTRACAWATVLDCIRDGVTTIFDHHASFGAINSIIIPFGNSPIIFCKPYIITSALSSFISGISFLILLVRYVHNLSITILTSPLS